MQDTPSVISQKNMLRLGKKGEDAAAMYLRLKGYRILQRNFHSRYGEIDIIAFKNETVVFVEVKTRGKHPIDTPASAVDIFKQKKIIKTAYFYIMNKQLDDVDMRFDVIEVRACGFGCKITHRENAFEV